MERRRGEEEEKEVSEEELSKHKSLDDCWVAIGDAVYDVTGFLAAHPGGAEVLLKAAGTDATKDFDEVHSRSVLSSVSSLRVGRWSEKKRADSGQTSRESSDTRPELPPIESLINVFDFQRLAESQMNKLPWDYYNSGADDEMTCRENHLAFQRLWFRPRVLVDVSSADTHTSILGIPSSFPLYVSACAMGKLAHPEGEVALARACIEKGVGYMIPTLGSYTMEQIIEGTKDLLSPSSTSSSSPFMFQLYVNSDRKITKQLLQRAESLGCRAVCITVDAPILGRRERDMRNKFSARDAVQTLQTQHQKTLLSSPSSSPSSSVVASEQTGRSHREGEERKDTKGNEKETKQTSGITKALGPFIDPSFSWKDLAWVRSVTSMPIVLKGIQTAEDAIIAFRDHPEVTGIIVSNHGGRQLDYARSSIEALAEITAALDAHKLSLQKQGLQPRTFEVLLDGGIRRGTDIFKALALGATGVGIGRPSLFGLATYGQKGVERVIEMLHQEFLNTMRLLGCTSIASISPSFLSSLSSLSSHSSPPPTDHLFLSTYTPLPLSSFPSPRL